MKPIIAILLTFTLSGCVPQIDLPNTVPVDAIPTRAAENATPETPSEPNFNIEELVVERWGDCLTALQAGPVSYRPNGDGFFPGVAFTVTPSGAIAFDVNANGDNVFTVPNAQSAELLATVGC
jgi:hypothetical protein